MAHALGLDIVRQLPRDVAGAIVAEQPRFVAYMGLMGIVTLTLVSHFWPLPEPPKSFEMLQRHEAKRSEFGGELCQRDNAFGRHAGRR